MIRNLHAGRMLVLDIYCREMSLISFPIQPLRIAVVGGDARERELDFFREKYAGSEVVFFGISKGDLFLDLNLDMTPWLVSAKYEFDVVICCQVLEHVWDVGNAVKNLSQLVAQGGFLWLNVPASNMKHDSPSFYSTGYQSELFVKLFKKFGILEIASGEIGTKRLYRMTHKQQFWPSVHVLRNPFLRGIDDRRLLFPLKFVKYFFFSLEAMTWSNKIETNSQHATETYFLGFKT
jgi:2-polyprenyl-3-methyl-5-hydroxy-6-metoxy-1,4-benzoquinol methylase